MNSTRSFWETGQGWFMCSCLRVTWCVTRFSERWVSSLNTTNKNGNADYHRSDRVLREPDPHWFLTCSSVVLPVVCLSIKWWMRRVVQLDYCLLVRIRFVCRSNVLTDGRAAAAVLVLSLAGIWSWYWSRFLLCFRLVLFFHLMVLCVCAYSAYIVVWISIIFIFICISVF